MNQILILLLSLSLCTADIIARKKRIHSAYEYDKSNEQNQQISSAHVVVSKEGPPPSPQEYTISKLEESVVCSSRGDKTWAKWKDYDLDGVCSRLQYYGEIEGQCETDCDALCPQGFYEVTKEHCNGLQTYSGPSGAQGSGYYRKCVGRYKCTQSSYDYWVNMKWWQFLIWEVVIIIVGCCFCGLAVGCCIRCYYSRRNRGRRGGGSGTGNSNAQSQNVNQNENQEQNYQP